MGGLIQPTSAAERADPDGSGDGTTVVDPASEPSGHGGVQPSADAQEIAAALEAAERSGVAVEVGGTVTPTERTMALADGTLQLEQSTVPVRAQNDTGDWSPIDTDLVLRDGWWEPANSATPVRFSSGGSNDLSQIRDTAGSWLSETWPFGELPAPEIAGAVATYVDVLPDVDLRLTATELGMASVYVIGSAAAAADPRLADLHVVMEDVSVSRDQSGTFTADASGTDTDGSVQASSPLWWDSSDGGDAVAPGNESVGRPVEHDHSDTGISLDVTSTVAGEDVLYPIFVDPDWSASFLKAWYTNEAYPTQSYLSASADTILRVGRYNPHRGNMFFEFNLGALSGKRVLSAQLSTTQIQWAACPNSPLQVRTFGPQSAGFTWAQQNHSAWGPVLDTKNPGSCGSGRETVGWDVTSGVADRAGQSVVQFGFAPQDENAQSRRHFERGATLYVSYNSPPDTPTSPTIDSPVRSCGTEAAPAHVSGSSVVISVDQTDPDPGNVDTNFHLYSAPSLAHIASKAPGLMAPGRRSVTFTDLAEGAYAWNARGSDWIHDGVGFSSLCYFNVDNTKPAAPTVKTNTTSFKVGTPVTVSMSGTSDTAGYQYWFTYTAAANTPPASPVAVSRTKALPNCSQRVGATRFRCANGTTAVTVSVAPVDALSTLWVSAYDKAGNVSTAAPVRLYTSTGTPAARDARVELGHGWMTTAMIDPLPTEIPDSNGNPAGSPLSLMLPSDSLTWQKVTELRPGYTVPVLVPHEPPTAMEVMGTPGAAVDTTNSFSVSIWIKPSGLTQATQLIALQDSPSGRFMLQLKLNKLSFCREGSASGSDNPALVSSCATLSTPLVDDEWVLVTGIWDRSNEQLRISRGATPVPVALNTNVRGSAESWSGQGEFMIGPPPTSWRFNGLVANPVVVPGVLDSRQLGLLAQFQSPFLN